MSDCAALEQVIEDALRGGSGVLARMQELTGVEECVLQGLRDSSAAADWGRFHLYVSAAVMHPSASYVPVLGEVLGGRVFGPSYEDVATALGETRDDSAVPYLVDAVAWESEWDAFRGIAVKAVWALGWIGSPAALAALRAAAEDPDEEISRNARAELERPRG